MLPVAPSHVNAKRDYPRKATRAANFSTKPPSFLPSSHQHLQHHNTRTREKPSRAASEKAHHQHRARSPQVHAAGAPSAYPPRYQQPSAHPFSPPAPRQPSTSPPNTAYLPPHYSPAHHFTMGGPGNKNRAAPEHSSLPEADAPYNRASTHVGRQMAGFDGGSDGRPTTPPHRTASPSGGSRSGSQSPTNRGREEGRTSPPSSPKSSDRSATSPTRSSTSAQDSAGSTGAQSTAGSSDVSRMIVDMKKLDLGMHAFNVARNYEGSKKVAPRGQPSKLGTSAKVALNTFNVLEFPQKTVYQYEVLIGSGTEKRGLIEKVWESGPVKSAVGPHIIFDGNRLAWSLTPLTREVKAVVDLDKEQGRTPRPGGKTNTHRVHIRQTNKVRFDVLQGFLDNKCAMDNQILEAINFLDHLLREYPSHQYTQIKRSFYARGEKRNELGLGVEAFKGCYQSLRIVKGPTGKACLSVNLDVANGTFFNAGPVHTLAYKLAGSMNPNDLVVRFQKESTNRSLANSPNSATTQMKKLRRLQVHCKHRGKDEIDYYTIDHVTSKTAKTTTFDKLKDDGSSVRVTVQQYFKTQYNINLQHPDLPLVKMTKGKNTVLPMELLFVKDNQRYPFKCNENQTKEMIKFAVTPPSERWKAIEHGLRMLNWSSDPVLKHFGLKISGTRSAVEGRLLPAPKVTFATSTAAPGTSGRWDLKNKRFLSCPTTPLKAWSVNVACGRRGGKPALADIQKFVDEFVKAYVNHGGKVENKHPTINILEGSDVGTWVTTAWNTAGNQANMRPQMLVFVLPDRDSTTYGRIKRSADCRYGVHSQCMQFIHVQKAQPQYISNVLMKFNAKLGGTTCKAVGAKSGGEWGQFGKVPTLVIGADVSHAAPGQVTNSAAAVTCSIDKLGIRYAANVESNGFRVEMVKTETWTKSVAAFMNKWLQNVGNGRAPERLIYLRDGVSEGQYQHVIDQEVADIKAACKKVNPKFNIPMIVIVGSKRHHVRFFPERGDRNGNPLPGTLIQSGVTHPYENDWYLCAHAAIKGTARPVHYQMLLNETNTTDDEIFTMLYEQSYQYQRATTPVSIHPAIYYAHLAAARAVYHDPSWGGSDPNAGPKGPAGASAPGPSGSGPTSTAVPASADYMPVVAQANMHLDMWYI